MIILNIYYKLGLSKNFLKLTCKIRTPVKGPISTRKWAKWGKFYAVCAFGSHQSSRIVGHIPPIWM